MFTYELHVDGRHHSLNRVCRREARPFLQLRVWTCIPVCQVKNELHWRKTTLTVTPKKGKIDDKKITKSFESYTKKSLAAHLVESESGTFAFDLEFRLFMLSSWSRVDDHVWLSVDTDARRFKATLGTLIPALPLVILGIVARYVHDGIGDSLPFMYFSSVIRAHQWFQVYQRAPDADSDGEPFHTVRYNPKEACRIKMLVSRSLFLGK